MQVNILEAKTRLSQLVRAAQAGEEIVIANRGEPVARLVPPDSHGAALGTARQILDWLERHPLPKYARRTSGEIDAAIEAERHSWD
ncbi:MAG TPA: type II toxin-antitoxin system prevent-host-death family antitoxin [Stellaceae bacterium]|nr:type II toxin-antitoxin system prevent-host-death family antitoxin [Stellaceae bacterium]